MKISLQTVSFRSATHQVGHHNYRNRTACLHRNRKPLTLFTLASSMDCGCPATKTLCNMATILQLICQLRHAALVLQHTCTSWQLSNKASLVISWPLPRYWFSFRSQAQVRNFLQTGAWLNLFSKFSAPTIAFLAF